MAEALLTIKEVADQLKVSEITIRRMLKSGELVGSLIGSQWRFRQSDVDSYIDGRRQEIERDSLEG